MIILMCGKKQSGKDSLANAIIEAYPQYNFVKCGFADELKEMTINLFGLKRELIYGTNEDKNTLTEYTWADMPHIETAFSEFFGLGKAADQYLTYREFLQELGTNIMRQINPNCWVNALVKKVEKYAHDTNNHCLIIDGRFPQEIDAMENLGAKSIRLARNVFNDQHESETALDNYQDFDYIVDNQNESFEDTKTKILQITNKLLS
jgi:hypothetical protein